MSVRKDHIRKLCIIGALSAVAFVLMLLEVALPFLPAFLKLDFSEIPALLAAFALGPFEGAAVCLVKNLLHLLVTSTAGVGELSNFLLGCCFVLPAGIVYRYKKTRAGALLSSLVGVLFMAAMCVPINYCLTYPIYYRILVPKEVILGMCQTILPSVKSVLASILIFNVPLTLAKGLLDVAVVFLIYKKISPLLKRTWR